MRTTLPAVQDFGYNSGPIHSSVDTLWGDADVQLSHNARG